MKQSKVLTNSKPLWSSWILSLDAARRRCVWSKDYYAVKKASSQPLLHSIVWSASSVDHVFGVTRGGTGRREAVAWQLKRLEKSRSSRFN